MNAKRIIIKHLIKSLGDAYWMATLKQRLYRLQILTPKPKNHDYQYEESEV